MLIVYLCFVLTAGLIFQVFVMPSTPKKCASFTNINKYEQGDTVLKQPTTVCLCNDATTLTKDSYQYNIQIMGSEWIDMKQNWYFSKYRSKNTLIEVEFINNVITSVTIDNNEGKQTLY